MKNRQIKKNSKTAMQLLMRLDNSYFTADNFSVEDGVAVAWYPSGGMEPEWDYEPAFEILKIYLENHLSECDFVETDDDEHPVKLTYKFTPDLRTAKKVFFLAKQLIKQRKSEGPGV